MFVLCIDIEGQKLCHENIRWPYIKLQNLKISLEKLRQYVRQALSEHKVNCVLRARHDRQVPLFELHFTSNQSLEKFVMETESIVYQLQQIMSPSKKSDSLFKISFTSYLVLLHKRKIFLLTKENYKQLSSKFSDSHLFQLERRVFESAGKLSFKNVRHITLATSKSA